jgi:cytochrome bd-type quinol oxidase subunit 2
VEFLYNLVVVLHFVGLALLLGAFLVQVKDPQKTVTRWMWDGALTMLLTGVIMVGLVSAEVYLPYEGYEVDHAKIGVKLAVVVVIAVLAFIGKRRPAPQVGLWAAVGLLTLANVVIAVFW